MGTEQEYLPAFKAPETEFLNVVTFWFGGTTGLTAASPQSLSSHRRKKLWFVSDEDRAYQQQVDAYISNRFGALVHKAEGGELEHWGGSSSNPVSMLALVLLLDQFSRHIYRNQADQATRLSSNTHKAAEVARAALSLGLDKCLETTKLCFLLMPLRHVHADDAQELEQLVRIVEEREKADSTAAVTLERFKSVSQHRIESARRSSKASATPAFADSDILAEPPLGVALGKVEEMEDEPLYHSLVKFLLHQYPRLVHARMDPKGFKEKIHLSLVVSLSGGVDSMVIARILAHIARTKSVLYLNMLNLPSRKRKRQSSKHAISAKEEEYAARAVARQRQERLAKYKQVPLSITVKALHVDYGNRLESHAEAAFVRKWCNEHNIVFVERRIEEVSASQVQRQTSVNLTFFLSYVVAWSIEKSTKRRQGRFASGCTGKSLPSAKDMGYSLDTTKEMWRRTLLAI